MTEPLDESVVERVNEIGTLRWSGTTYRHTAARYDPLSGHGAYLYGGRWNPRESFAAVYLAQPVQTCLSELERMAEYQNLEVADLLQPGARLLHTIEVFEIDVLDLREPDTLRHVGLDLNDISDDDRTACQAVGQAAYFLGMHGVLAPSATGVAGLICAAYESRLGPGKLTFVSSQDLSPQRYEDLMSA